MQEITNRRKEQALIRIRSTPYKMAELREIEIPLQERFRQREVRAMRTALIEFQGDVVKARCFNAGGTPPQGGERGVITEFSKKARKHMLETVSRMDWTKQRATFITLTYHEAVPDAHVCKNHLRALLKRFYREYGQLAVLWRLELQKRGAWHFHLIIWGMPYLPKDDLLTDWRSITGQPTITQVDIKLIDDAKKARSYVAKYIGKDQVSSLLDYMTNRAVGRFWGMENRKNINWAERELYSVTISQGYTEFQTAARGHWGRVGYGTRVGFTIFVDDVQEWEQVLLELVNPWGIYDWAWAVHDGLL
jgi:hypothetical protein